jgi:hypothetical protein
VPADGRGEPWIRDRATSTALMLNQAHRVDRIKVRSAFREVKCITGKIIAPDGPKAL